MKKYIYTIAILSIAIGTAMGQTQKAFLKAADEAYESKNYYGALKWYGEALDFDKDDPEIIYKLAQSARGFEAYDIAAEQYKIIVDSLGEDKYPEAALYLGEMYQRLGKYEESKQYYNMFISEYSNDTTVYEIDAEKAIESIDYALTRLEDIDKSADIIEMKGEVNTPYSEFGALMKDSTLYFSTMRYAEENPIELPARGISKLHTLINDVNEAIEGEINDTDLLVAHSTFSTDGQTMVYTICEYINDEDVRCDLYSKYINEDGSFGNSTKLPSPINIDSTTSTQPQISYDSLLQKDVLYFVSDREGGSGKLDIYYSEINDNGSYSDPVELKEINTPENEATPFLHRPTKTLYFSSDGRMGLGGYDVYFSEKGNDFSDVTHMRIPVNSSYHDLYYVLNDIGEEAYFSTNREGSQYIDPAKKACCFDIYKIEYDEVILDMNILVFDEFTKEDLDGATLTLIDSKTGEVIEALTNEDGNDFYFKVRRDREYTLQADRPYYNSKSITISTVGITESKTINKEIYLKTDRMQLLVETFNKRTKEELEGVQITIKNLTTGEIDTVALNETGNKFILYPKIGYNYEIEASKFGFVTEEEPLDLSEVNDPGLIEKKMYLEVFDIEDYMPVTVYFENDQPNPRSKSTATNSIYGNLYSDYMGEKLDYIKNFTKRLKGQSKEEGSVQLDAFFEGEVVGGYDKLKRFMRALKKELKLGRSLEIAIKGYTSPLADTRYNLALGQRRVSSVENEILNYEGGIFREYVANGKLIITDISFGEETSPKDVSDTAGDTSKSIYSVKASKERRVQIVKITDQ